MRLLCTGLVVALAFGSRIALASPVVERIARYEAPDVCPTQAAAETRLSAHLDAVTTATPALFTIVVTNGAPGYTGVLEIIDATGARATRELKDVGCDEVVWSLVFIAALAISPEAKVLPPVVVAPSLPPPPPARADPEPPALAPAPTSAPPDEDSMAVEAGAVVRVGPLPQAGIGAAIRASYRMLALAAELVTTADQPVGSGNLGFWLLTVRPQVCPLASGRSFRVEACAGFDAGVIHASSDGIADARSVTALWIAPELAARARLLVSRRLFLAVEARAGVPLHRPSYVTTAPEREAHTVPVVVGAGIFFAGVSW